MIIAENYELDGVQMVHTFSDKGVKIHGGFPEGDYDEAHDPAEFGRTYVETEIPIEEESDPEEIVDILTGVSE